MPNPPEIMHAGDKAFYSPTMDRVTMPPRILFESAEEDWATLWHETAGHATAARITPLLSPLLLDGE